MQRVYAGFLLLGSSLLYGFSAVRGNDPITFQSSETRGQVLELFTSQGCSSCPPAERWLNQFLDHPGLWTEIIPVVFHVDYWDRLGWKDPFANQQNTSRQYRYSKNGDIRNVYTPCFVSNGKEWRGWFDRTPLPKAEGKAGILSGTLIGNNLSVSYSKPEETLDLHILVLGCNLQTDVRRGENRGKLLKQQFVTLAHKTVRSSDNSWNLDLPEFDKHNGARYALSLFVTAGGKQAPIQATGNWLQID